MIKPQVRHIGGWLGLAPKLGDRGYLVCAVPRSGSKFLDELLISTGVLGKPREYFNAGARRRRDPVYPTSTREQFHKIRTIGATDNGIYAAKVFPSHLQRLDARIDLFRDLPDLRLVRLRRRDLLGQAISLARARQTGQFRLDERARRPAYDHHIIRASLEDILRDERAWDDIFARLTLPRIELDYESLIEYPQRAVDQVAVLMDVPLPVSIKTSGFYNTIQRDDLSEEWRRRFVGETGDEFAFLATGPTPPSTPDSASAS
ncbi:MAG TPA: Stf0 family sulfotransferase [Dongiaceae bacterium]|nr:Stf0 family sulfotransferase [Dongiaceae bacterium]